jgi:hypothetical protein
MQVDEFIQRFQKSLPVGTVLNNPGGGTSTILKYAGTKVCYQRGAASFDFDIRVMHQAVSHFAGRVVSANLLRSFDPEQFSPPHGHSGHCIFLFTALVQMKLAKGVQGSGAIDDPFAIQMPAHSGQRRFASWNVLDHLGKTIANFPFAERDKADAEAERFAEETGRRARVVLEKGGGDGR